MNVTPNKNKILPYMKLTQDLVESDTLQTVKEAKNISKIPLPNKVCKNLKYSIKALRYNSAQNNINPNKIKKKGIKKLQNLNVKLENVIISTTPITIRNTL